MKLELTEHQDGFEFALEPESMQDCAMLARFALNATKEVMNFGAHAHRDLSMFGYLMLGKRKQPASSLKD